MIKSTLNYIHISLDFDSKKFNKLGIKQQHELVKQETLKHCPFIKNYVLNDIEYDDDDEKTITYIAIYN